MTPIALRLKKRRRELTAKEEEESHRFSPDFTRINQSEAIGAIERQRAAGKEERMNRGERIEDTERIKKLTLRDSDSSAVKEKKKRTPCRGRGREPRITTRFHTDKSIRGNRCNRAPAGGWREGVITLFNIGDDSNRRPFD